MIRILLADDDPWSLTALEDLLAEESDMSICARCHNGHEVVQAVLEHNPDLMFLDIEMPGLSGLEAVEALGGQAPPVIFVTAWTGHALAAFDAAALDYLVKPVNPERLSRSLNRFRERNGATALKEGVQAFLQEARAGHPPQQRLLVPGPDGVRVLPCREVLYIQADGDYIRIHMQDGSQHLKTERLGNLEKALPPDDFIRVHRSFLVRLDQILRLEATSKDDHRLVLRDQTPIPISRRSYPLLMARVRYSAP